MNNVKKYKVEELIVKQIKGLWGEELGDGETGIKVVKTNNMSYEGRIDFSDICQRRIAFEDASNNFLQYGDLLIEKSGGTKTHSVGYVNFFDGANNEFVCNNFILAIRPNQKIVNPKYLFYYLKYLYESGSLDDCYNKTTGIQNLKTKTYLQKVLFIPSIGEQNEIVSILDFLTASATNLEKQIKLYSELINSRFNEMFGDCKAKKPLDELTTKITDGSHNPPKGVEKSEYIMLSSQNVHNELDLTDVRYLTKEDFEIENKRTDIQKGDVLLTIVGTIGRTHVVKENEKFTFQRSVGVIKPANHVLNGTFLSIYLHTEEAIDQLESGGHGSSQKGIYLKDIKKLLIPVVEIDKQLEFENFVNLIDKSKYNTQQHILALTELVNKKAQEYFGGNE